MLRRRAQSGEKGVVAIWVAMAATVIFGIGAFAVDVAQWYVEGARLQKAVDNAALSGVVFLPGDPAQARTEAQTIADLNGWTIDGTEVTFEARQLADRPTRLQVTMSSEVEGTLGGFLGVPTNRITKTAVADYAGPVPLGSPCNLFGRQDMEAAAGSGQAAETNCLGNEKYWVNTAGQFTNKARGDGYSSGYCTKADASDGGMDACEGTAPYTASSWTTARANTDYDPEGYTFIIKPLVSGDIRLQAYDIGWAAVGDNCTDGVMTNNNARGWSNEFVSAGTEAQARYERGNTDFCTGDTQMGGAEGDNGASGPVITTVTVRNPSPNPWQPLDGTTICTHDFPGWGPEFRPNALRGGTGTYNASLARTFHRWMDPCARTISSSGVEDINQTTGDYLTIPAAQAGDEYSVQIKTRNGGGQNRYALRARMAGSQAGALQIFAAEKVSLFNNVPAGQSTFNVVRLDSSAAGKVLNLRFFDLGDATQPVSARLLQPDSTAPFDNCTGVGPTSGPLSNCEVTTRAATNGGKWQTIRVPIPGDYRCTNDTTPNACWVRVRLTTSAAQSDTTTWSAGLDGDPVRLVQ